MVIVELVVSLGSILGAAILFTNAIEILGERLNLGQGAVGSVLAAVGTALPETIIPVVALIGAALTGENAGASSEIGIGAILGAPFLLATLALFIVGVSALGFRHRRESGTEIAIDKGTTRWDIGVFLVFFGIAAGAGIVPLPFLLKVLFAALLVGAYIFYVWRTIRSGGGAREGETPEDLALWPEASWDKAPMWAVVAQVLGSLAVMGTGAHFFVEGVEQGSESIGIPAGLIALVLAPLATELPEKLNSVIWLREDKDILALGNISGAMVFQSSVPVCLGLLFTPWSLDLLNALSAGLALASGVVFFTLLSRKAPIQAWQMLGAGSLYIVFVAAAVYQAAL